MQTQEDRNLYRDMLKSRDERTLLQAIAMLLCDIHDELVYQRGQKETPRPGRQPATTKG